MTDEGTGKTDGSEAGRRKGDETTEVVVVSVVSGHVSGVMGRERG